ncbi:MAG: hypothetical protein HC880_10160 [Bacteroidia bacterium]|nr:hypothetical protein [Bacteroidia bacterium]
MLATLSGGCVLIDKSSGHTLSTLNYFTGLPDNEVLAANRDRWGGLWICHEYGISRVHVELPLRNYSNYLGLQGNVISVVKVNATLYTATSEGLFYLSEATSNEEIEGMIQSVEKFRQVQNYQKAIKTYQAYLENRKKKNLFNFNQVFRNSQKPTYNSKKATREARREARKDRRDMKKGQPEDQYANDYPAESLEELPELDLSDFSTVDAGEIYATKSQPFVYRAVEGLNGKCRQLLRFQNRLLVASNLGLYEVIGQKARLILPNVYINFIYQSIRHPKRMFIATNQGLLSIRYEQGQWVKEDKLADFYANVYSIAEEGQSLWLGSENEVFRVSLDEYGHYLRTQRFGFEEGYSRNILVRIIEGNACFFLNDGIYTFNHTHNRFVKDDQRSKFYKPRSFIVFNQPGYTWMQSTNQWINIAQPTQFEEAQSAYLQIFENIQDIYVDDDAYIWVVSNNTLYRLDKEARLRESESFHVFIKNILDKQERLLPLENLVVNQEDKSLSFRFQLAAPYYLNESYIQYSYWLEGLDEDWSSWNRQSIISFPFLPSGYYKLHVKARNIFGQISEDQVFSFRITPPFWETWWFYALQTTALLGMVMASFYFNRSGRSSELSHILVFVTIITFFEFMILLVEPYVDDFTGGIPVFKLIMNVILALSLAPIERAVNRWAVRRRAAAQAPSGEVVR